MCDGATQWINAHTVVAMDTTERVHLLNVRDDTPIEVPSSSLRLSLSFICYSYQPGAGPESGRAALWL